jgi:hypothetical protein
MRTLGSGAPIRSTRGKGWWSEGRPAVVATRIVRGSGRVDPVVALGRLVEREVARTARSLASDAAGVRVALEEPARAPGSWQR